MSTLIIKTDNETQLSLLANLAKELGIHAELTLDDATENKLFHKLAESSFSKDWNTKEDDIWTEFLKNKEDVSKG